LQNYKKNSPADASTGVIFISPARVNLISPEGVSPACPKGSITRAFSIMGRYKFFHLLFARSSEKSYLCPYKPLLT
ncbi:MAG: hypothetical protein J6B13_02965, partial [Muribaculaceae bacterium]|nr:hypothetical protein [Muribaculaceae bacterium]